MRLERIRVSATALGVAVTAYEAALKYARERKAFGKTIGEFENIMFKLVDIAAQIECARLLTHKAAQLRDRKEDYIVPAAMAKLVAGELAQEAGHSPQRSTVTQDASGAITRACVL